MCNSGYHVQSHLQSLQSKNVGQNYQFIIDKENIHINKFNTDNTNCFNNYKKMDHLDINFSKVENHNYKNVGNNFFNNL
jgi:hypothetical protein